MAEQKHQKVDDSHAHEDDAPYKTSTVDANGVDRSLIRWYLTLTPSQRLRHAVKTAIQLERLQLHRSRT